MKKLPQINQDMVVFKEKSLFRILVASSYIYAINVTK